MRKNIILFTFLVITGFLGIINFAHAETEVSGNISSDTTWTLEDSPYIVTDVIQVFDNTTLNIEPGVTIKFSGGTYIAVGGELIANGTTNQKIIFTSNSPHPSNKDWRGIWFIDSSVDATVDTNNNYLNGSIIKNCVIEYSSGGIHGGTINLISASPYITNNTIRNNYNATIYAESSNLVIKNNNIENNTNNGATIRTLRSNVKIYNNNIENNTGNGIEIGSGNVEIVNNRIQNNRLDYPQYLWEGVAINIRSANSLIIKNNIITNNNSSNGSAISVNSDAKNVDIEYNNIYNNNVLYELYYLGHNEVDFIRNYWGSSNVEEIDNKIYDYNDNISYGQVNYKPYAVAELNFDGSDSFSGPSSCITWAYSDWSQCSSSGQQTRTIISSSPNGCTDGNPVLTQSCVYTPPTCNSWNYTNWSECTNNGQQTRNITGSHPENCSGGSPTLTQNCNFIPNCTNNDWSSFLTPNECPASGKQAKKWMKVNNCQNGVNHPSEEQVDCNYQAPTCSEFDYSEWANCENGTQIRKVISSRPENCTNGQPVLKQSCKITEKEVKEDVEVKDVVEKEKENEIKEEKEVTNIKQIENSEVIDNIVEKNDIKLTDEEKEDVLNATKEIIKITEKNEEIGQEVKEVLQKQTENQKEIENNLEKIQKRSKFIKFFIGSNYKKINETKELVEKINEEIKKLEQVKENLNEQDAQQILNEQIQLLEQSNQDVEKSLDKAKTSFSLFGWLVRLFNR